MKRAAFCMQVMGQIQSVVLQIQSVVIQTQSVIPRIQKQFDAVCFDLLKFEFIFICGLKWV